MALQNKFIVFNKAKDYEGGVFDRCKVNDDGQLLQEEPFKLATYISPVIDALEVDTWWSKLIVNMTPSSSFIKIKVYASNTNFNDLISSDTYSVSEKMLILERDMSGIETHYDRTLLNRLKGRYLCFVIQIKSNTQELSRLDDIKIEFPVDSFIRYFPAMYTKNLESQDFFFRFISIFQDIYMEIETSIDQKFLDYDPYTASSRELRKLIDLINFQEVRLLEEDAIRRLVAEFDLIIKLKGTRLGIQKLTALLLNKQCDIIESYKMFSGVKDKNRIEVLERDYCNDPYHFAIKIYDCKRVSQKQKQLYITFMDEFVPAKTHYKVIFDTQVERSSVEISTESSQIPMKL